MDLLRADLDEKLLDRGRDALYFLWEEPFPPGNDDATHRCLRGWALLHALRLAEERRLPDKLLATTCQSLSLGARDTETRDWRDVLAPFGAPADSWEAVNARLDARSGSRVTVAAQGRHRSFLTAAGRLAKGENEPMGETSTPADAEFIRTRLAALAVDARTGDDEQAPDFDAETEVVAASSPSGQIDLDAFAEEEVTCVEVDPESTTVEHQLTLHAVQLRLGEAARFLPWGCWDQLTPPETEALGDLIEATLTRPADARQRFLAALVQVALTTGMSLEQVAGMPLSRSPQPGQAWSIDLESGRLIRRPPRHDAHWKPHAHGRLLNSAAQALCWLIDPAVLGPLRMAAGARSAAAFLGQLRAVSPLSLRQEFRAWVKSDRRTARIEGAFLKSALGLSVHQRTQDAVLARLLAAERQTLPASTVYTGYLEEAVRNALPRMEVVPSPDGGAPFNVAGSRLDPVDDDLLMAAFAEQALTLAEHKRNDDWLAFHNAVALHWDAALRAATGVRPVNDLWKSDLEFDWENAEVFVDDKASPLGDTGRLVPLPRRLSAAFHASYVRRHLPWVLRQLELAGGTPEAPSLLFMVTVQRGAYVLESVQNRHRNNGSERLYEGRLPLNLFRHRLRTRLHRRSDVDLEVVDTVMGHRDGATLTHGSFSMRVWRRDAEAIRPALEALFDKLHFQPPPLWLESLPTSVPFIVVQPARRASAMAERRKAQAQAARAEALDLIRQFVGQQAALGGLAARSVTSPHDADQLDPLLLDLTDLSEDQFDQLSLQLLHGESGMPSAAGASRYEQLIELAGEAWTRLGRRARIRRRHAMPLSEPSPFTALAPSASRRVKAVRQTLDRLFERAPIRSKLRVSQALVLAVYDLMLFSRIAHLALLESVVVNDASWRVVRLRDNFYLEWSPSDDLRDKPEAPVQRFALSVRCAWLLQHAIRGKARRSVGFSAEKRWSTQLADAAELKSTAHEPAGNAELLRYVAMLVDQLNAVELPGTVAAYLRGRICSASLHWGDWVRLHGGRWARPEGRDTDPSADDGLTAHPKRVRMMDLPEDDEGEIEISPSTRFAAEPPPAGARTRRCALADGAYALFAVLRGHLNHLRDDADGARHRDLSADAMAGEIESRASTVSTAVQLLGLWAIDLLLRPGRSRKLATSSVLRYFGALSPRFQAMAYDVELHALDDSEIEDFYARVLAGADVENVKDIHDGLRNFHLFASTAAGLPPIDWSVLGIPDTVRLGSPGWVDDETYLLLIERLGHDRSLADVMPWQLQCLAILARRFGLRGGEATGLLHDDIVWGTDIDAVIVRNNRERELKTRASRRVVPLVEGLTNIEREALGTLAAFHAAEGGGIKHAPLFGLETDPKQFIDGLKARARINEHLKSLTGQRTSTLHKLRKAFAVGLWVAIEGGETTASLLPALTADRRNRIRTTLLGDGHPGASRRGLWAVARALGHAGCEVGLRSYCPILSEAAASQVAIGAKASAWGLEADDVKVLRLDTDLVDYVPTPTPAPDTHRRITPLMALRALLHMAQGRSTSAAAEYTGLPFDVAKDLRASSEAIHLKLSQGGGARLQAVATGMKSRRLATQGLLSLVHVNAHARLRAGLASTPKFAIDRVSHLSSIAPSEWSAIVGPQRQISMWRPGHFELTAIATRHLLKTRRAAIELPQLDDAEARQRIVSMVTRAGFVAEGQDGSAALCDSITISNRLPRVKPPGSGVTIEARAAMRLTGSSAKDSACDGAELVVALLCLSTCARRIQLLPGIEA